MKNVLVSGIKMPPEHNWDDVVKSATKILNSCKISGKNPRIYKKSLDARRKNDIHYVYSIVFDIESLENAQLNKDVRVVDEHYSFEIYKVQSKPRVLVVGSGPCGLFASLVLCKSGADVTLIERGSSVEQRKHKIEKFWNTGILDPNCNIQFGEGGAGTFSDGKLTTRIGSPFEKFVLETFVRCGAPGDILYDSKPHIGTDYLGECVKNLRNKIIDLGGRVLFDTCLTDITFKDGRVIGATLNNSTYYECESIVLAIGHSSRDTYRMLCEKNVKMEQKAFAAGVRVEHSREFINAVQYGNRASMGLLPTADYRLTYNGEDRSVYSFCMCPGGVVVNASSEDECLVVNGMSEHSRMADNSNSALVVTVRPDDFEDDSPLAGVNFQQKYESAAYKAARGKGPVQLSRDFLRDRVSCSFDEVKPSFTGKTQFVDLRECLPEFICSTLKEGLLSFENKIKGFAEGSGILTGVEMRTSAPLRIIRDENFESVSHKGLYPAGEGAGYAGGIMSAAIDGIKIALQISKIN